MIRLPRLFLAMLTMSLLVAWASPGWTAEKPTKGTLQSVSADQHQLVVSGKLGKNYTHQVMEDAPIFIADQPNAKLSDLKTGAELSLLWEKKGDQYQTSAILVRLGDFKNADIAAGTIKSVSDNQFTVTDPNGKEWTYHMADKATLRISNKTGKLADFKANDRVAIVWQKEAGQYMVKAMANEPGQAR